MKFAKAARTARSIGLIAGLACAAGAIAQTVPDNQVPEAGLNLPANLQIFGKVDPNVRKPTAIVNDTVITGTDVDQRVALIIAANGQNGGAAAAGPVKITDEERDRLKLQVLRTLIDETLQIQEARAHDITVTPDEITQSYVRVARNFGKSPQEFSDYLATQGSSQRSLKRQIEGELAWQRLLRRRVQPFVNVGDEEVQAILKRLEESRGTPEFHLKEIYLSSTPERNEQVFDNAKRIIAEIQKGETPFEYFARNFSEASTKAVDGDLDWVRTVQLPESLATAAQQMQVGQVAGPIEVPGGFSILYLVDKRQVLMADPRDAKLSLRQITVKFPAGITQAAATQRVSDFAKAIQSIQGCGNVTKVAAEIGAEVVDSDSVKLRDLPPRLQDIMLKLQVGETTPPFGSQQDGVRALVLCGRDDPKVANLPSADQIQSKLEDERVNLRAQRMLRDLRRDAVVEYR